MVQGLDTIQLAWSQIGEWSERYVERRVGSELFLQRLQRSLNNGQIIMDALEGDLKPYQTSSLSFKQRSKAVWNENTLRAHQDRISHQALAMTCLLQAVQLRSSLARDQLLDEAEPMLRRSDESAYSIVPSRMSSRISKSTHRSCATIESAKMEYRRLSFEDALFTAMVYKRNYRNQLIGQLFEPTRPRSQRLEPLGALRQSVGPSNFSNEAVIRDSPKSLQIHVQQEFAREQKKQSVKSPLENFSVKGDDRYLLLWSCREGDIVLVESCFSSDRGRKFSDPERSGNVHLLKMAMLEAVTNGHVDVAKILMNYKVPINAKYGPYGWQPLQFAAHQGDCSMINFLLRARAQVSAVDGGTPALHIASHIGCLDITLILLDAGAAVDSLDNHGFQPLHLASVYHDRCDQIALLAWKGADINAENSFAPSWQTRPLQLACLTGQGANVKALLNLGANPNLGKSLLDAPVGIAIRHRHVSILQELLGHGADPNHPSKSQSKGFGGPGMTPLSLLVKLFGDGHGNALQDRMSFETLLKHGANARAQDEEGNQMLHYLAQSQFARNLDFNVAEDQDLVMGLLRLEVDIDATNDRGETPLFLAALSLNTQLVSLLWLKGAQRLSRYEIHQLYKAIKAANIRQKNECDKIAEMMGLLDTKSSKGK
ncbi:hypothetical protein MMC28_011672, partial [Mycoblastus sanguinarius]|nr:hypothetical protein [Mycoblastus sanguinarius]